MPTIVVDNQATAKLIEQIMEAVRAHYMSLPRGPERVFEVLNALGTATGVTLAGTEDSPVARHFFDEVVKDQVEAVVRHPEFVRAIGMTGGSVQ